jgi:hypothetical protein
MRFFQRSDEQQLHLAPGNGGPASSDPLQQSRADGERLLAAGDEALRRALGSGNSEAFLRASKQSGGE